MRAALEDELARHGMLDEIGRRLGNNQCDFTLFCLVKSQPGRQLDAPSPRFPTLVASSTITTAAGPAERIISTS